MEQQIIESAIDIVTPVLEGAIIIAAEYSTACGRNFITGMDVRYGMRYAARTLVGNRIGSMFPEIYDDEEDDDDSDIEIVEENDENCFSRYIGTDEKMNSINEAYDTWNEWEPQSPMEQMLKNAVDSN
jgi:hypothetical protein